MHTYIHVGTCMSVWAWGCYEINAIDALSAHIFDSMHASDHMRVQINQPWASWMTTEGIQLISIKMYTHCMHTRTSRKWSQASSAPAWSAHQSSRLWVLPHTAAVTRGRCVCMRPQSTWSNSAWGSNGCVHASKNRPERKVGIFRELLSCMCSACRVMLAPCLYYAPEKPRKNSLMNKQPNERTV